MKLWKFLFVFGYFAAVSVQAQEKVFPVVKSFGGIYEIPNATVTPDGDQVYKIVIDVNSGPKLPHELNPALNNVARMINLHAVGGVPANQIKVVLAIHGKATDAILDNASYENKYEMANPNVNLIRALKDAGVKIAVCGQSLIGRDYDTEQVLDEVEIATSMLTTVTSYQQKGYSFLAF